MSLRAAAIAASVLVAGVVTLGVAANHANAVPAPQGLNRMAQQGFTTDFGSKHVVGYFTKADGVCNVKVVLTQKQGEDFVVGTGTTVELPMAAGSSIRLGSGEGAGLAISCGETADNLSIVQLTSGS